VWGGDGAHCWVRQQQSAVASQPQLINFLSVLHQSPTTNKKLKQKHFFGAVLVSSVCRTRRASAAQLKLETGILSVIPFPFPIFTVSRDQTPDPLPASPPRLAGTRRSCGTLRDPHRLASVICKSLVAGGIAEGV